jgi:hypothetical protein
MLKRLPAAGFVLAVILLSLTALDAARRPPRSVRIGGIRPYMNFSSVRLRGLVTLPPQRLEDGKILLFMADGTGSLPVFLDSGSPETLPPAGSPVTVAGRLNVGADCRSVLRVKDAAQLRVMDEAPPVSVRGRVLEVCPPPPGSRAPYRIVLEGAAGRLEAVHWFAPSRRLQAGEDIEVRGRLDLYRKRVQVRIADEMDIRRYGPAG